MTQQHTQTQQQQHTIPADLNPRIGGIYLVTMPWTEAMLDAGLTERPMLVLVLDDRMCQLHTLDGRRWGAPYLRTECGLPY